MALPILIFFERHWDTIPKLVLKHSLEELNERGYDTICFQIPPSSSSTEIIDCHASGLKSDLKLQQQVKDLVERAGITENLAEMSFKKLSIVLRQYASSQDYVVIAEKIKQLSASCILREILNQTTALSISIKGIDIDEKRFYEMTSFDVLDRGPHILKNETLRISTMFQNLMSLRSESEKSIIFVCGASHAQGLLTKFKENDLQNEVLYYFSHSASRYEETEDDLNGTLEKNPILKEHTHLLSESEIKSFKERIIKDITENTKYTKELLDGNSCSQVLNRRFKAQFRTFLRPGHYLDALVNVEDTPDIENIQKQMNNQGISTHKTSLNGREFLVIPNLNTKDIADKIQKML